MDSFRGCLPLLLKIECNLLFVIKGYIQGIGGISNCKYTLFLESFFQLFVKVGAWHYLVYKI